MIHSRVETLNVSLNKNYTNNFIYVFLMIFLWFHYVGKKREIFRYDFFMIFLWLNLWFVYDEIYDLVSHGFEEKK